MPIRDSDKENGYYFGIFKSIDMKEGWISDKFSNCVKLKSGDGLTAKRMIPGDFPVYGGNGIAGWHNQSNLDGKQIVIGRVGALCGKVRCINEKIWLTDNAFKISEYKYDFNHEFLTYLLNHVDLRSYARQAAQPVISNSSLKDVLLTFPKSLAEQKQIVTLLDSAFAKIDQAKANIEKNIANAKELFQSKLNAIFSQKGDGWEEKTFKELSSKIGDGLHGTPKYDENGEYFFINGNNLENGKIEFKKKTKTVNFEEFQKHKKELTNNTVLISINGTLGKVAFYNNEPVILGKSACYINFDNSVNKYFIKYLVQSPLFFENMTKMSTGATIKNFSLKSMRNYKLNLPPLKTQNELVSKMREIENNYHELNRILNKKVTNLEELKKSLLQKAFAGELTSPEGTTDKKGGSIPSETKQSPERAL